MKPLITKAAYRRMTIAWLATALLCLFAALTLQRWYSNREQLADTALVQAEMIGANAGAALVFKDRDAAAEILSALGHSPMVIEAGLYQNDGTQLARYRQGREAPGEVPGERLSRGERKYSLRKIRLSEPVMLDNRVVGSIELQVSQDSLYIDLASFVGGFVLTLLLVSSVAYLATGRLRYRIAQSERLFDSFFDSSPAGMAIVSARMQVMRINHTLAEANGATVSQCQGQALQEALPLLAPQVEEQHRSVIAGGHQRNLEIQMQPNADAAQMRYWLSSIFPLLDAEGQYTASGWVAVDITEGKRAELARKEVESRLQNVSALLPVTLFQLVRTAGADGTFTYVSDKAQELLGISAERLLTKGRELLSIVRQEDKGPLKKLLCGDHALPNLPHGFSWEGRINHPVSGDGWLEILASVTQDDQGRLLVSGVMLDVSELKKYQRELESSRHHLRQMIAHRESILEDEHKRIAIEIHDQLGQILTAALLNLRTLKRSLGPVNEEAEATIRDMEAQLNGAYLGMKDIATALHPAALTFGLVPALEWLSEKFLKLAGISWHIDTNAPLSALNQHQSLVMFRIAQEAFSNAVRHGHPRTVVVSLTLEGNNLVMEIGDDGSGFAAGNKNSKLSFGLIGMRERAEAIGGDVSIRSAPGAGTRVRVTIPLPPP